MGIVELIRELRRIADVGIVNHRHDTAVIREAADRLEDLDERVAIMAADGLLDCSGQLSQRESQGTGHSIYPGENIDLLAALEEGKRFSGLTEEE